jgi:hypothetical protein
MPRIRTIKPEFCVSAQVAECSKNARLLFVLMWMFCDDNGVHPANPKQLRMECFPGDDDMTAAVVTGLINELLEQKLLTEYENNGQRFWLVSGWKHQRIDKPQPGKYPRYDDDGSVFVRGAFREQSASDTVPLPPDRKGEERKGEEGIGKEMKISDRSIDSIDWSKKDYFFWHNVRVLANKLKDLADAGKLNGLDFRTIWEVAWVCEDMCRPSLLAGITRIRDNGRDKNPKVMNPCAYITSIPHKQCDKHGLKWDDVRKLVPEYKQASPEEIEAVSSNHHGGNHAEAESTAATVAAS